MSSFLWAQMRRWLVRYLPAEIGGTVTALAAASIAYATTHSLAIAAVSGSTGETIGYYGIAAAREIKQYYRVHREHARIKRMALTGWHTVRGMLIEFGLAEFVDSLFVRPFLFYQLPQLIGIVWLGWIIAKLCADVVFYCLAILGYAARRKALHESTALHQEEKT